jgi:hypothetical protein
VRFLHSYRSGNCGLCPRADIDLTYMIDTALTMEFSRDAPKYQTSIMGLNDLVSRALTWENAVSEDQGLPIGHDSEIALTKDFAMGGAQ